MAKQAATVTATVINPAIAAAVQPGTEPRRNTNTGPAPAIVGFAEVAVDKAYKGTHKANFAFAVSLLAMALAQRHDIRSGRIETGEGAMTIARRMMGKPGKPADAKADGVEALRTHITTMVKVRDADALKPEIEALYVAMPVNANEAAISASMKVWDEAARTTLGTMGIVGVDGLNKCYVGGMIKAERDAAKKPGAVQGTAPESSPQSQAETAANAAAKADAVKAEAAAPDAKGEASKGDTMTSGPGAALDLPGLMDNVEAWAVGQVIRGTKLEDVRRILNTAKKAIDAALVKAAAEADRMAAEAAKAAKAAKAPAKAAPVVRPVSKGKPARR